MGKGNRNRNDRYEDVYSMSGTGAAVKPSRGGAKKDRTTALLITIIAVLLLASLAIYIFSDSGIMERSTVYVSSENFEVTGTMLPYFENLEYTVMFQWYYSLYSSIYSSDLTQAYNAAMSAMGNYTLSSFFDAAINDAKQMVALAEEALSKGVTLDVDELADIEQSLKEASPASFGSGVKKKDIRAAMELQNLAAKYSEMIDKEIDDAITAEEVLAFVNENKADYYTADALKFTFTLKASDYSDDTEGYAAAKALADSYAEKLAAATTAEEFKKTLIEYHVERDIDKLIFENKGELDTPNETLLKNVKEALVNNLYKHIVDGEDFDSSVTTNKTYAELFETIAPKLQATAVSALGNLSVTEKYTAAADDEALAWLSSDETKVGDTKVVEKTTETEYSKIAYIVTETMHLDESATKDVAHILIKAASSATEEVKATAKAKATKALAEFLAGEQTLEAFEKLAETYNEDSGSVYEGVTKGQMVKEFEDWTFDEARKAGDTEIVETQYGYHVMYFIGEGDAAYYTTASEAYSDEKYEERVKALEEAHVTLNDKAIAKKTTTEETTAA